MTCQRSSRVACQRNDIFITSILQVSPIFSIGAAVFSAVTLQRVALSDVTDSYFVAVFQELVKLGRLSRGAGQETPDPGNSMHMMCTSSVLNIKPHVFAQDGFRRQESFSIPTSFSAAGPLLRSRGGDNTKWTKFSCIRGTRSRTVPYFLDTCR